MLNLRGQTSSSVSGLLVHRTSLGGASGRERKRGVARDRACRSAASQQQQQQSPLKHASARHPPARLLLKAKTGTYTYIVHDIIIVFAMNAATNGTHTLATDNLYHPLIQARKSVSGCGVHLSGDSDDGPLEALEMMMITRQNTK